MTSTSRLCGRVTQGAVGDFTVDDVIYDLWGPTLRSDGKWPGHGAHEGTLGISATNYDWYHGARLGCTPDYPNGTYSYTDANPNNNGEVYSHHNVWGQVVPLAGTHTVRDVRLHIDIPYVYHLAAGASSWTTICDDAADAEGLEGGYFNGAVANGGFTKKLDFAGAGGPYSRTESTGWSIDLSKCTTAGGAIVQDYAVVHWFFGGFYPRIALPVGGQVAIMSRMKLITDGSADLGANPGFVGCFAGDVFTGANVGVNPSGINPPFAIPRHKRLTASWQYFTHVTGTQAQIRQYPKIPFLD